MIQEHEHEWMWQIKPVRQPDCEGFSTCWYIYRFCRTCGDHNTAYIWEDEFEE